MEIKVGEFVRTKEGYIAKLIHYGFTEGINGKNLLFDSHIRNILGTTYEDNNFLFDDEYKEYIVKHSFNIMDLIEVGDYVNGELVREPIDNGIWAYGVCEGIEQFKRAYGDIKSIVTKEQFESVEYEVK